jgi:hypothetical protein
MFHLLPRKLNSFVVLPVFVFLSFLGPHVGPNSPQLVAATATRCMAAALDADPRFRHRTPFGGEHARARLAPASVKVRDYRSYTTVRDTLGIDSHGFRRSLQVDVGCAGTIPGNREGAPGYADLDCDNPAQDVVGGVKHGVPIIFRRIRGLYRR